MKKFVITLSALMLTILAFGQDKRMAVIDLSTCYLRLEPDYESPLETQELMGSIVEIIDEKSYWRKVVTDQPYTAWCTSLTLAEMTDGEIEEYKKAPKVMFTGLYGHIFSDASEKSASICDLVGGDVMRITGKKKGGWIQVKTPSGKTGWVKKENIKRHDQVKRIEQGQGYAGCLTGETGEKIIAQAEKLLGVPYLWGGMSSKGVDCSGLVRISYLMNGVHLPRNASQQINCGDAVMMDVQADMKTRISNLKRGDLVFFGTPAIDGKKRRVTHVGIYLGEGRMIHSSHCVRINSLIPGEPDFYENSHRLIGAVRFFL